MNDCAEHAVKLITYFLFSARCKNIFKMFVLQAAEKYQKELPCIRKNLLDNNELTNYI